MKSTLEKRTLNSTLAGGLFFILTFIQSIVLVPLFLKYWGDEKYGVWISLFAFVELMRTFDLGHQSFVGNEFQKLYHNDKPTAKFLLGGSVRIGILLGFLELLLFLIIAILGYTSEILGLSEGLEIKLINWGIFSFLLSWWLAGSVSGILIKVILPLGLYAQTILISLIMKIAEITIIVFVITQNFSILTLCICLSIAQFLYSLGILFYIKHAMTDFFPWWEKGSWKIGFKNLWKSLVLTINGFLEKMNTNGLIILISNTFSAATVPIFTTVRTLSNVVSSLTNLIMNPLLPELIKFHSKKEGDKIKQVIETNWLVSGVIVNVPFVILVPIVEWLYALWTQDKLEFDPVLFFFLTLSVSVINFGRSLTYYLMGINHLRALAIITGVRFIIVFGFSLSFLNIMGLEAAGLALLIAEVFSSILIPYFFSSKELENFQVRIPFLSVLIGLGPLLTISLYYYVSYVELIPPISLCVITLLVLSIFFSIQWIRLDYEVKSRLLSLLRLNRFFKR